MESTAAPWSGQQGWHIAQWGPLGWAEAVIKAVGIVIAIAAAIGDGAVAVADTHRLSYWLLLLVAIGYLGTVFDRLVDREVVAMVFVACMVAGHWAAVYAMGRAEWPAAMVQAFVALMLLGDLVKLGYFATTKASVRGLPWTAPFALTSVLAGVYLVALVAA